MATDHQVTEHEPADAERGLGVIVTAAIVIATLVTVAWLATR
jgi:hypothetical protein